MATQTQFGVAEGYSSSVALGNLYNVTCASGTPVPFQTPSYQYANLGTYKDQAFWYAPQPGFVRGIRAGAYSPTNQSTGLTVVLYKSTAGGTFNSILTSSTLASINSSVFSPMEVLATDDTYAFNAGDGFTLKLQNSTASTSSITCNAQILVWLQ